MSDMPPLHEQIMRLTQPAADRMTVFMTMGDLRDRWEAQCQVYALGLLCTDDDTWKRTVALRILSFTFPQGIPETFWGTDLGQLLYWAGGLPDHPSRGEAAQILRVSPQFVSDLVKRGHLVTCGNRISAPSLRMRWERLRGTANKEGQWPGGER